MKKESSLILGICIIIGFLTVGMYLKLSMDNFTTKLTQQISHEAAANREYKRYEFINPNEKNIIIFDTKTGRYWRKYIEVDSGPTEWREERPIFLNKQDY